MRSRTALKNADCPARAPADRADRSDQVLVEDGRHLFSFPLYYQTAQNGKPLPLDYVTLVSLASKELLLQQSRGGAEDEFMLRVILSCRNISRYVEERADDQSELSRADFTFIEAEQSLLLGHLMHPTPKAGRG